MGIPAGLENYKCDSGAAKAHGRTFTSDELTEAINGDVALIISDYKGQQELADLFAGLATTGFEQTKVLEIVATQPVAYDWRVGEAIAEAFLTSHRSCDYPWPGGRDLRNPSASAAGTDLVGFQSVDTAPNVRFAFGEVKTSDDQTCPPSVMYGRHGLKQQLEALRDDKKVRDALVRYLAVHAVNAPWRATFQLAAARYIRSSSDVALFGVLIRDISPNSDDLRVRAEKLGDSKDLADFSIELLALYLPIGSIAKLPAMIGKGGAK